MVICSNTLIVVLLYNIHLTSTVDFSIDSSATWAKRLYNFTDGTEQILKEEDDASKEIKGFPSPLPFCTDITNSLYICSNGIIAFNKKYCPYSPGQFGSEISSSVPVIAPFYADLILKRVSNVPNSVTALVSGMYLRGQTNTDIIERATNDVRTFTKSTRFYAIWVHVSTWYNARAWSSVEGVTFQLAIITDGIQSFARFSYGPMNWATVSKSGQVGYKFPTIGNNCKFTLNVSLTGHGNLKYPLDKITGNVGELGVWIVEMTSRKSPAQNVNEITVDVKAFGSIDVNLGERLSLYCSLSGFIEAEYVWFRDNKRIENTKPFYIVDSRPEDVGSYKCGIELNGHKQLSEKSLNVRVKYMEVPVVRIRPGSTVPVNTTLVMECRAHAFPPPTFAWYKTGRLLPNETEDIMTIQAVSKTVAGNYHCVASNLIAEKPSQTITVDVWELNTPTVSSTSEGYVAHGSKVTMTCTASGNANPSLAWMDADQNILSNNGALVLDNVDMRTSGTYVCQARREDAVMLSRMIRLITTYFNQPTILADPSNMVLENTKLTLNCSVDSLPPPSSFAWSHGNANVQNTSNSNLVIASVTKASSGIYTCTAFHMLGSKTTRLTVTVQYLNTPQILKTPNDLFAKEGSNVLHYCDVDAFPTPSFIWYRNTNPLIGTQPYLMINNASLRDQGAYSCEATNAFGTKTSQSVEIRISYIREPKVEASLATPAQGADVVLTCVVDAVPEVTAGNFVWQFENSNVIGSTPRLTLNNIQVTSSGTYTCIVGNYFGNTDASLEVIVKYLTKPRISVYPDDVIAEGDKVTMLCQVEGRPIDRIEWLKDSVVIGRNSSSLSIVDVQRADKGVYKCVAHNGALVQSSDDRTIDVNYVTIPTITFSSNAPTQWKPLNITCQADSKPLLEAAQYMWKFNGKHLTTGRELFRANLTRLDSGVYECSINHVTGVVSKEAVLNVTYLDVPTLTVRPSSSFMEGGDLLLNCTAHATHPITYAWFYNGAQLQQKTPELSFQSATLARAGTYSCRVINAVGTRFSGEKTVYIIDKRDPIIGSSSLSPLAGSSIQITCTGRNGGVKWLEKGGTFVTNDLPVVITGVSKTTSGYYVCKERSNIGIKMAALTIKVLYVTQPVIAVFPKQQLLEGMNLTLIATMDTSGNETVVWLKDDLILSGKTKHELSVLNVSRLDSGMYKCQVQNQAGTRTSTAVLVDVYFAEEPQITVSKMNMIESDKLTVMCQVTANPPVVANSNMWSWKFNGRFVSNARGNKLTKSNISRLDSGVYECSVRHVTGWLSKSTDVFVKYISTPILSALPSSSILKSHPIQLICTADTISPLVFYWFKDGVSIANINTPVLSIASTHYSDAGNYTCQVRNEAGTRTSKLMSVVILDNDNPVIIASTLTPVLGSNVRISCGGSTNELWVEKDNKVLGASSIVQLNNVTQDDSGLYVCYEKSSTGTKMTSLVLRVLYVKIRSLVLLPSSQITNGSNATIFCDVISNGDKHVIKWFKDGNELLQETSEMLRLPNIKRQDSGLYKCQASGDSEISASKEIPVNVNYLNVVTVVVNKTRVTLGDVLLISCNTDGNPTQISYAWKKDGEVVSRVDKQLTLRISSTNQSGYYECTASNMAASKQDGVYVNVNYLNTPVLTRHPSEDLNEGHSTVITCEVDGTLPINYTWYHNDVIIEEKSSWLVLETLNGTTHDGSYRCLVTNILGTKASHAIVISVQYLLNPVITSNVPLQNITSGHDLVLTCSSFGNPVPSYDWYHNNKIVATKQKLELLRVRSSKNGVYVCRVTGHIQTKETNITLVVNYLKKPTVKVDPTSTPIEMSVVTLSCSFPDIPPASVKWYHDNALLSDETGTQLKMNPVSRRDNGTYTCVAWNEQNSLTSQKFLLSVQFIDPPNITSSAETIIEKADLTLKCVTSSTVNVSFHWYKDNALLANTPSLVLNRITTSQAGLYECVTRNSSYGEARNIFPVVVEYMETPTLTFYPADVNVWAGASLIITCTLNVTANLPITYKLVRSGVVVFDNVKEGAWYLKNVSLLDIGEYSCVTVSELKELRSNTIHLDVTSISKVLIGVSNHKPFVGDFVLFRCSVISSKHPIQYKWIHNERVVAINSTFNITNIGAQNADGDYTCETSYRKFVETGKLSIKTQYLTNTSVSVLSGSHTPIEFSDVVIQCRTNSSSKPIYSWYRNDRILETRNSDLLVLANITKQESGAYSCRVSIDERTMHGGALDLYVYSLSAPTINPAHEIIVHSGSSVTLTCTADSAPETPSYIWYFEGKAIIGNNSNVLLLSNIASRDKGSYMCIARNSLQMRNSSSIEVYVTYVSTPTLEILPLLRPTEGSSLTLYCHANSSDIMTFNWYRDGYLLHTSKVFIFVLSNIRREQSGNYTCAVTTDNVVSTDKSSTEEVVVYYLDKPIVTNSNTTDSNIELNCLSSGRPRPTVQWTFKEKHVTTTSKLVLPKSQHAFLAEYKCIVNNSVAEYSSVFKGDVVSLETPHVEVSPSNEVDEGSAIVLNCKTKGTSPITYQWYVGNSPIANIVSQVYAMNNVSRSQRGSYTCHVANGAGKKQSRGIPVVVRYLNTPVLTRHPAEDLNEGHSTVLTCEVDGTLPINYTWYHNDVIIKEKSSWLVLETLNGTTHDGSYRCLVTNIFGRKASHANIISVQYLLNPVITSNIPLQNITSGHDLVLTCSSFGNPVPSYDWYHDNKIVATKQKLELLRVRPSKNGVYVCRVTGHVQTKETNITLVVNYLKQPTIKADPTSTPIEMSVVTLSCSFPDIPPASVKWYHDNALLSDETVTQLKRNPVSRRDNGTYTCVAWNEQNSLTSQKFLLSVQYIDPPNITSSAETVAENADLTLECVTSSTVNVSFHWYKDNALLANTPSLVLNRITTSEAGIYECVTRNSSYGEARNIFPVVVEYMKTPTLTFYPADVNVRAGASLIITCTLNVTANLPITYKLVRSGVVVFDNAKEGAWYLKNVSLLDIGEYSCVTVSELKELRSNTIHLDVTSILKVLIEVSNHKPFVGDFVLFRCSVISSKHPIQYKWIHNERVVAINSTFNITNIGAQNADGDYTCETSYRKFVETGKLSIKTQYLTNTSVNVLSGSHTPIEFSNVVIQCRTNSSSKPIYSWYRNDRILEATNSDLLVLADITKQESGAYSCRVSIDERTMHGGALDLYVYSLSAPTIEPAHEIIVHSGSSVTLTCTANSAPETPSYIWYFEGEAIIGNDSNVLLLSNIAPRDKGSYMCIARNSLQMRNSSSIEVYVTYVTIPTLEILPLLRPTEGSSLTLYCHANSSDVMTYNWYRDGNLLHTSKVFIFVLSNIRREQSGNYTCAVSTDNVVSTDKSSTEDVVVYYLDKPTVTTSNTTDSNIELNCLSSGQPRPTVQWTFKEKHVTTTSKLVLPKSQHAFLAEYKCIVNNSVAEYSSVFKGDVVSLETPHVEVSPSNEVDEGSAIVLNCKTKGTSPITYQWYIGNSPIANIVSQVYAMNNVSRSQRGSYTCHVTNGAGKKQSRGVAVVVRYLDRPNIKSTVKLDNITVNQDIELKCETESFPQQTTRWFYRNTELVSEQAVLRFTRIQRKESGLYKCLVGNGHRKSSVEITLEVHYVEIPLLTLTMPADVVIEGMVAILKCDIDSSDSLLLTWHFNDRLLKNENSVYLVLEGLVKEQSGRYSCHVGNRFGWKTSNDLVLDVMFVDWGTPRVVSPQLKARNNIMQGTDVVMICELSQNSILRIIIDWYHDDNLVASNSSVLFIQNITRHHSGLYICKASYDGVVKNSPVEHMTVSSYNRSRYNHCASNTQECDVNAECLNGDVTYYCRCNDGYVGNGSVCSSVAVVAGQSNGAAEQSGKVYESTTYGLGAILAILAVTIVVVVVLLLRRRKQTQNENSTDTQRSNDFLKPRGSISTQSLTNNSEPNDNDNDNDGLGNGGSLQPQRTRKITKHSFQDTDESGF